MEELAELEWLANVGELAGSVVHEFNNFLNNISLHLALLKEERSLFDQDEIREQISKVTFVMKQFQQYRWSPQVKVRCVDLNRLIQERIQEPRARLQLATKNLLVMGSPADLRRLCHFLVANALRVTPENEEIDITTRFAEDKVLLQISDSGPAILPELMPHLFEPSRHCRAGTNSLELAACKLLVRRLQGRIQAENRRGAGLTITVELPAAAQVRETVS